MKFKVLTYDNKVGIVTDAELLTSLIKNNITPSVTMEFIDKFIKTDCDIGIWIQNFDINLLNNFKKNIFFINEEWAGSIELNNLHCFDYVVCKSKYVKELLSSHRNVIHLPFISTDYYDPSIIRSHSNLHFAGRSIQKNTELVLKQDIPITLIDSYNRYKPTTNFNHINAYQTNKQLVSLLNSHNIHICCSLYESWGHYLFEGLSTGAEIICSDIPVFRENLDPDLVHFIPTTENIYDSYLYCRDNKNNLYPMRKSFFVDESVFKDTLQNFIPIGKNRERQLLFKQIVDKNSKTLVNFFKNI
jgi:hypothetical protein